MVFHRNLREKVSGKGRIKTNNDAGTGRGEAGAHSPMDVSPLAGAGARRRDRLSSAERQPKRQVVLPHRHY